jgi:hypothetical protein
VPEFYRGLHVADGKVSADPKVVSAFDNTHFSRGITAQEDGHSPADDRTSVL